MTQLRKAREGTVTPEMERAAAREAVDPGQLCSLIAEGVAVLPANRNHPAQNYRAIGRGLSVKVNANIGTSSDYPDPDREERKLLIAIEAGADAVMDLSTGGDIRAIRKRLLAVCDVPLGTVPVYEAAVEAVNRPGSIVEMTPDAMVDVVRRHAEDGVDFVTLHCGVTADVVQTYRRCQRICRIVSRGGAFCAEWIIHNEQENPLYARFDEILDICLAHDVTLSLGDGLRPGALADAFDAAQVHELIVLAELADRAREADVQVMIEGPGHVPLDQIRAQVELQKKLCKGAPFYVLGPLVTDIAPGYDHITSAIGGALAAWAGADFLCYVTPSEHLSLPDEEQVRQGVMASRIAAHAGDLARGMPGALERDAAFSRLRAARDWEGQIETSLDPEAARRIRNQGKPTDEKVCSMCGAYCPFALQDRNHAAANAKEKRP